MFVVDSDRGVEGNASNPDVGWPKNCREGEKQAQVQWGLVWDMSPYLMGSSQTPEPWLVSSAAPSSPGRELSLQLLLSTDSGGFSSLSSSTGLGTLCILTPAGKCRARTGSQKRALALPPPTPNPKPKVPTSPGALPSRRSGGREAVPLL